MSSEPSCHNDSMDAALIYQHATSEADRAIAAALNAKVKSQREKARKAAGQASKPGGKKGSKRKRPDGDDPDEGAAGALVPVA